MKINFGIRALLVLMAVIGMAAFAWQLENARQARLLREHEEAIQLIAGVPEIWSGFDSQLSLETSLLSIPDAVNFLVEIGQERAFAALKDFQRRFPERTNIEVLRPFLEAPGESSIQSNPNCYSHREQLVEIDGLVFRTYSSQRFRNLGELLTNSGHPPAFYQDLRLRKTKLTPQLHPSVAIEKCLAWMQVNGRGDTQEENLEMLYRQLFPFIQHLLPQDYKLNVVGYDIESQDDFDWQAVDQWPALHRDLNKLPLRWNAVERRYSIAVD